MIGLVSLKLSLVSSFHLPREIGFILVVGEGRGGGLFFSLVDAYKSNFSLLRSLELLENFVVGGCPTLRVRVNLGG